MVAPFFGDTKKTLPAAAPAGVPDERGASDPPPHAATTSVQAPSTAAFMRRFLIETPFRMVTKLNRDYTLRLAGSPGSLRAGVACGAVIADYVSGLKLALTFAGAAASTVTDCVCVRAVRATARQCKYPAAAL